MLTASAESSPWLITPNADEAAPSTLTSKAGVALDPGAQRDVAKRDVALMTQLPPVLLGGVDDRRQPLLAQRDGAGGHPCVGGLQRLYRRLVADGVARRRKPIGGGGAHGLPVVVAAALLAMRRAGRRSQRGGEFPGHGRVGRVVGERVRPPVPRSSGGIDVDAGLGATVKRRWGLGPEQVGDRPPRCLFVLARGA